MTYWFLFCICILFFILGFLFISIYLLICKIRIMIKGQPKSFKQPAKFVPKLDLEVQQVQPSVDNSSATKRGDFKIMK